MERRCDMRIQDIKSLGQLAKSISRDISFPDMSTVSEKKIDKNNYTIMFNLLDENYKETDQLIRIDITQKTIVKREGKCNE